MIMRIDYGYNGDYDDYDNKNDYYDYDYNNDYDDNNDKFYHR